MYCKPGGNCTFNSLDAAEVAEPAKGSALLGTLNCQTTELLIPTAARSTWRPIPT